MGKTEESKLKPCPFCGHKARILPQKTVLGKGWMLVRCEECPARMNVYTRFQKQCVAEWNYRKDEHG